MHNNSTYLNYTGTRVVLYAHKEVLSEYMIVPALDYCIQYDILVMSNVSIILHRG